jgi:1-acyl-sn-glycerol-3-phosphate acyltransferase
MAARWAALRTVLWTAPLVVWSGILFVPLWVASCLVSGGGRFAYRLVRAWSRLALRVAGVRVQVVGGEKIAPGESYVFVAHHRSALDLPALFAALPAQFRLLVDKSCFSIPLVGFCLRRSGQLPLSGASPREALETLTAAARRITERGLSLVAFPEAEPGLGATIPFRDGAAYVAIRAGVPLVWLAIEGAEAVLAPGKLIPRRGAVRIRVGDPIPTLDLSLEDRTRLSESVRAQWSAQAAPLEPLRRS